MAPKGLLTLQLGLPKVFVTVNEEKLPASAF
jgi:hypothetical protein